ncbi:MAG: hypothetical protein QNL57_04380 [Alphaproteobacteria bacterium]
MTYLAYIFKVCLLARFAIIFLLGVLSVCGGGGSGSAEQRFSAQPRISLADFDNSLFGQASSSRLIVAEFVMATDTYQARRLTGQDVLESYINKLPSQEHLRKMRADTQWVNAAWISGRNVAAGVTKTVFEHPFLNGEFFVWGQRTPFAPLFSADFDLNAVWHCCGCTEIHGEATGTLSFSAPSSEVQLSLTGPAFSLQSNLSLTNKADFFQSSVVSSQLSINRQPLTVGGSQVSGGLFGPPGTEIGVFLDYQTASGGVGIMAIGKQTAN